MHYRQDMIDRTHTTIADERVFFSDEYDGPFENPYFFLWVCSQLASSIYTYTWDIKMDWGLFDNNAGDNTFLREELVYSTQVRGRGNCATLDHLLI